MNIQKLLNWRTLSWCPLPPQLLSTYIKRNTSSQYKTVRIISRKGSRCSIRSREETIRSRRVMNGQNFKWQLTNGRKCWLQITSLLTTQAAILLNDSLFSEYSNPPPFSWPSVFLLMVKPPNCFRVCWLRIEVPFLTKWAENLTKSFYKACSNWNWPESRGTCFSFHWAKSPRGSHKI